MRVKKCDICKKNIKRDSIDVYAKLIANEFCLNCAKPILNFLKKHKLLTKLELKEIAA